MNHEFDEHPDTGAENNSEDHKNEDLGSEITEIDAEAQPVSNSEKTAPRMSRKKKILIITVSIVLGLILILTGIGVFLFNHYYNKMDIQGRDDVDADERVIKLFDSETGQRYTFAVSLVGLSDEDAALIDNWYISNKELVVAIGKDPAAMTKTEKEELLTKIFAELRRLAEKPTVTALAIKVYNTKDDKEYIVEIVKELIDESVNYAAILEFVDSESDETVVISFDGDPAQMTDEEKTALYALIANEIVNMQKVRYPVLLKDSATGKESTFMIYEEELDEEHAKLVLAMTDVLTLVDVPSDLGALDAQARAALIERIVETLADLAIPRYTIRLRDPASNTEYAFVIRRTELTETQLLSIVKQIDRGILDLTLSSDPNLLDDAGKQQVIADIMAAIDLLENPPKVYQITVKDRVGGTTYILSFDENEVTDAQLVVLLPKINEGSVVSVPISKDPATMSDNEKTALLAEIVTEIVSPSRALLLMDSNSGKNYTLYFRDSEVTASQLSYLTKQIQTGNVLRILVSKDPSAMTPSEKAALIEAIVTKLQTPPAKEYKLTIRDNESGTAYILIFTKEEVNDTTVFAYLLQQVQEGTTLDMTVSSDPAKMTDAQRQDLFKAACEAIKNKLFEKDNPELEAELRENLENIAKNPIQHTDNIYNVLLVGTDERGDDPSYARNSDTMILATVNYKDGTITLTSLMRDTGVEYTYMSGGVERKNIARLNSAYAVGGIKTLISAIESNYGVTIDNYVKVNWFSFIDIFTVLGGIDVTVDEKHLDTLNKVLADNCWIFGEDYEENKITSGGYQHLNPIQTLAYARYRVSDADFGRTKRQREVLTIVFNKFKNSNLLTINNILNTVLPMLTTDLTKENCASLLIDFVKIAGFKMQQVRLPEWNEYTSKDGILWPDWEKTLKRLYKNAYGSLCPEQYK